MFVSSFGVRVLNTQKKNGAKRLGREDRILVYGLLSLLLLPVDGGCGCFERI